MTHTYNITGMTCAGCQYKVQTLLSNVPGVTVADINLAEGTADVSMSAHIPISQLQDALKEYPKYQLTGKEHQHAPSMDAKEADNRTWFDTYKPILLLFSFITGVSLIAATRSGGFDWMQGMAVFMSGFFLAFSFFKLLNLNAFADSYAMYDIVAKKFKGWGYIYSFIELLLGVAYALHFQLWLTSVITLVVMSISIIGVMQSVLNKRQIQCACLGAVFNLPMSTVTIIEDALMIVMSGAMIWLM